MPNLRASPDFSDFSPALPCFRFHRAPHPRLGPIWAQPCRGCTPGNSGQNLYVNRRGELETIRHYDIDGDGWLDLFFNSTHDTYNAVPATFATAKGTTINLARFGVDGSSRVVPHDLNRDGFTDLVFMPNQQNIQKQRASVAIAWGRG